MRRFENNDIRVLVCTGAVASGMVVSPSTYTSGCAGSREGHDRTATSHIDILVQWESPGNIHPTCRVCSKRV